MKLSTFAILVTVLSLGFGLAFIFVPVKLMAGYGISLDPNGVLMGRSLGMSYCFLGLIFWTYRNTPASEKSWRNLLLISLVYDLIQLVLTVIPVLNGVGNSMGWSIVATYALLAIGSGYYLSQSNKAGKAWLDNK